MKFLVLALCVCAASAASVGFSAGSNYKQFKNKPVVKAQAVAQVSPARAVAQVSPARVVATAAKAAVSPALVVPVPVPAVPKTNSNSEADAETVRNESEIRADGYSYGYETSNGISGESTGVLKKVDDTEFLTVQGSYRYVAADGTPAVFTYVADENGYRVESDLLPVGPEIPEAIARSIAYIASQPKYVEPEKKN